MRGFLAAAWTRLREANLLRAQLKVLLAAALLCAAPSPGAAFEQEAEKTYPATAQGGGTLAIISTADLEVFEPLILAYQRERPSVSIRYVVASSKELFRAIGEEGAAFDIAISSAMDLQTKLANDGHAAPWRSAATAALPDFARWRDRLFAFTQEPAVMVLSKAALNGAAPPASREELIDLLRADPDRLSGRVGVYDVRSSGLGYLFATQDARQSESFWRLVESIGALRPRLYCCSADMIAGLESGELLLAYNVLGSYATERVAARNDLLLLSLSDYTHIMLRTALTPRSAPNPAGAGDFIDFLVREDTRALIAAQTVLAPLNPERLADEPSLRPITLGPGLMVYLDRLKRRAFLRDWSRAMGLDAP